MLTRETVEAPEVGSDRRRRASRRRLVIPAAAAAAGVLILAGCGGHKHAASTGAASTTAATAAPVAPAHVVKVSKASYEKTMKHLGGSLSKSMSVMYPLVDDGAGTPANKEAAARVEKTRDVVVHIASTLNAIEPPKAVQADHKRLVAGLGRLEGQLNRLIGALTTGGARPIGAYTEFTALNTIAKAASDMEKKGYSVGG